MRPSEHSPDFSLVKSESLFVVCFLTHFREVISFLVLDFEKRKVEGFVRGILNTNYRLLL
jgi:hypothetical protein